MLIVSLFCIFDIFWNKSRGPKLLLFLDQHSRSWKGTELAWEIRQGARSVMNDPKQRQVFEYSWHHARRP